MTTTKTKVQIINETVEYYSKNPRGIDGGGNCRYLGDNGTMCAFARCCTPDGVIVLSDNHEGKGVYELPKLDSLLSADYHGHGVDFWGNLQHLHDTNYFWDKDGLTERGENQVILLISLFTDK